MAYYLIELQDAADFDGQRPFPVGSTLQWDGNKFLVVGVSTALASAVWGDLSDVDMTTAAPTTGQFAYFDGSDWVPTDIDGGSA